MPFLLRVLVMLLVLGGVLGYAGWLGWCDERERRRAAAAARLREMSRMRGLPVGVDWVKVTAVLRDISRTFGLVMAEVLRHVERFGCRVTLADLQEKRRRITAAAHRAMVAGDGHRFARHATELRTINAEIDRLLARIAVLNEMVDA